MKVVEREGYVYIEFNVGKATVVFFTSKGNLNFKIHSDEGKKNILKIKDWFNLRDIGYMSQIHSNFVKVYDGKVEEVDAIVTDEYNVGLGVFTADCVPVLLYDTKKDIAAAIHSGWRGTFAEITKATIDKMKTNYGCSAKNITAFIGPHIRDCCYEVSSELIEKFEKKYNIEINKHDRRKLSLEYFIRLQCSESGILSENIVSFKACNYCTEEYEFHSYRKNNELSGRMLSLIFLKH